MKDRDSHPDARKKYGSTLLDSVMKNPKLTTFFLLVLAATPFVITALIMGIVFLGQ